MSSRALWKQPSPVGQVTAASPGSTWASVHRLVLLFFCVSSPSGTPASGPQHDHDSLPSPRLLPERQIPAFCCSLPWNAPDVTVRMIPWVVLLLCLLSRQSGSRPVPRPHSASPAPLARRLSHPAAGAQLCQTGGTAGPTPHLPGPPPAGCQASALAAVQPGFCQQPGWGSEPPLMQSLGGQAVSPRQTMEPAELWPR